MTQQELPAPFIVRSVRECADGGATEIYVDDENLVAHCLSVKGYLLPNFSGKGPLLYDGTAVPIRSEFESQVLAQLRRAEFNLDKADYESRIYSRGRPWSEMENELLRCARGLVQALLRHVESRRYVEIPELLSNALKQEEVERRIAKAQRKAKDAVKEEARQTRRRASEAMGLYKPEDPCPHCGFTYGWDGRSCEHCKYRRG